MRGLTGIIAGTIIGAIGLSYAIKDKGVRRKMTKDGRKVMNKANSMVDNFSDMF